MKITGI